MTRKLLASALATVVIAALAGQADAQSYLFRQVADSDTAIPGGTGVFDFSSLPVPSIDGGIVAFKGDGTLVNFAGNLQIQGQRGIYAYDTNTAELSRIADLNTAFPGAASSMTLGFSSVPSVRDGKIAFEASAIQSLPATINRGVFIADADGSNLTKLVDYNTSLPGSATTFGDVTNLPFGGVALTQSGVAYSVGDAANNNDYDGIFLVDPAGASLQKLAATGDTIPGGGGQFTSVASPMADGEGVVFYGKSSVGGTWDTYRSVNGTTSVLLDANSNFPVSLQPTTVAAADDEQYVMTARQLVFNPDTQSYSPDFAAYLNDAGQLSTIVDESTTVPSQAGTFALVNNFSLDDGQVIFKGQAYNNSSDTGIYTSLNGELSKVITLGDTLAGKSLTYLDVGTHALSNGSIAFSAIFQGDELAHPLVPGFDFQRGIFIAVPLINGEFAASDLNGASGLSVNGTLQLTGLALSQGTSVNVSSMSTLIFSDAVGGQSLELFGNLTANGSVIGDVTVKGGGVLSGSANIYGNLFVEDGGILNPGNSPGVQAIVGDVTWGSGGILNFQLLDANGAAGSGWDLVSIDGDLIFTATPSDPFEINLSSLSRIGPDFPGVALNWNPSTAYSFEFLRWTGDLLGTFDPTAFNLNTAGLQGLDGRILGISHVENSLFLDFSQSSVASVPEPSSISLSGLVSWDWRLGTAEDSEVRTELQGGQHFREPDLLILNYVAQDPTYRSAAELSLDESDTTSERYNRVVAIDLPFRT